MEYTSIDEVWEDFEPIDENFNKEIINQEENDNLKNDLQNTINDINYKNDKIKLLEEQIEKFSQDNKKLSNQIGILKEEIKKDHQNKLCNDSYNHIKNCPECLDKLKSTILKENEENKENTKIKTNSLEGILNNNKDFIIIVLLIVCIHFIIKTLKLLKSINKPY